MMTVLLSGGDLADEIEKRNSKKHYKKHLGRADSKIGRYNGRRRKAAPTTANPRTDLKVGHYKTKKEGEKAAPASQNKKPGVGIDRPRVGASRKMG